MRTYCDDELMRCLVGKVDLGGAVVPEGVEAIHVGVQDVAHVCRGGHVASLEEVATP